MKTLKSLLLIAAACFFMGCELEEEEFDSAWYTSASESASSDSSSSSSEAVTAVSLSGPTEISYNGTATFTASATYTGSSTLTYKWSISSGSSYAAISGNGESATLTANNTTDSQQTVTVKVTVSNGENPVSETASLTVAASGVKVKDELTALSLSAASETISSCGKTKLTASATYTGSPSITYSWEITSGGDYAYFTSEGEGVTTKTSLDDGDCKITGNNTSDQAQSVTVKVTASDGENSFEESVTITVAAKAALSDSYNTEATVDTSTYSNVIYVDLESGLLSSDNANWTEITTSAVQPVDSVKVKFTEDDDGLSTGLIKINASSFSGKLAVYLSGKMSEGGVKIQSNASDTVAVYLNDAEITSSNYPCVEVTKGSAAIVDISGTNVFVDGRNYGTGYGEEYSTSSGDTYTEDGTTYSCTVSKSVVSEGSDSKGSLYSKGNLTVTGSGSLSVTQAYKNCIASKDGLLTIESGTLTLQNYLSSSTKTSSTGKNGLFGGLGIVVNDGSITFNGYGIVSTSDLRKANGFKTDDEDYPSSYVKINGGTVNVTTYNGKGINAPVVAIAGGTNTFTVTGTTSYSESTKSGSWYDADGVKETGTVKFAPEGIEGASSITISGGSTIVSAPDDGINVSNSGGSLSISGGFLYVKAQGDGLDSNGNITISGGVTVVSQTGNGNSPIDCGDNYKFTVTGTSATVFAMGGSGMFSESIPSSTTIPMIYSTSCSGSTSLGVNGIIALASPQSYGAAVLVSPSLTSGTSYSFVKGGTLGGTVYNSDAGVYFPAQVSGGTSVSCTATTQGGSGSSMGGFSGGSSGPGGRTR